jgi:hypothetical protein
MEMLMNKTLLAIIIFIVIILGYAIEDAVSDTTSSGSTTNNQTSTTGSQTAITGGYSQESTTTYQSGSSSNTTTNSTTNNNNETETAVNSSNAPSMSVYGQDSCVIPLAAGVTVIGFSGSFGSYMRDEECERRKKSKLLKSLGMSVASISIMCQNFDVWKAMADSGTYCPIDGLIGAEAKARWEEIGGFYRTKAKTWNGEPIPSGAIKHKR